MPGGLEPSGIRVVRVRRFDPATSTVPGGATPSGTSGDPAGDEERRLIRLDLVDRLDLELVQAEADASTVWAHRARLNARRRRHRRQRIAIAGFTAVPFTIGLVEAIVSRV